MDETTTTTTTPSMTRAAWKTLQKMLDAFYEMARMLVALFLWPLRALGLMPPSRLTPTELAREVLAEHDDAMDVVHNDIDEASLGFQIRAHARSRIWAPEAGDPILERLPPIVAAWLDRMDRAELSRCATIPPAWLQQHVEAGPLGQLKSSLGLCTAEEILAKPVRSGAAGVVEGRSGKGGGGGQKALPATPAAEPEMSLEQMLDLAGCAPEPALRYR